MLIWRGMEYINSDLDGLHNFNLFWEFNFCINGKNKNKVYILTLKNSLIIIFLLTKALKLNLL